MAKVYADLIRKRRKTLEDVPTRLRAEDGHEETP